MMLRSDTKESIHVEQPSDRQSSDGKDGTPKQRRVHFAGPDKYRVRPSSVHNYEAPSSSEKELMYMSGEELGVISQSVKTLLDENRDNEQYLDDLGTVLLNDLSPPSLERETSLSSVESISSSFDSSFSPIAAYSSASPDDDDNDEEDEGCSVGRMRGLELLFAPGAQEVRKNCVRKVLAVQQKLRNEKCDPERKERLLCRKSQKYTQNSCSIARKMAEWDAWEACRILHQT